MNLTGLHLLLSYQCTFECDHCFVWGSPQQTGVMTRATLRRLHLCQGLVIGNLLRTPLRDTCRAYAPADHPIAGPLLAGGPAELVRRYDVPHAACYGDACHLCDAARRALRARFPEILAPDQRYGVAPA